MLMVVRPLGKKTMSRILIREEIRPWRIWVGFECGVHWNNFFWYISKYGLDFRKFKNGGGFAIGPIMFHWGKETVYVYELEGEADDDL